MSCLRLVSDGQVATEVRTFQTTTADLLRLSEWLAANECTHVAMEATGVYWKPVRHILDDGEFELVLANAAHVKNVPGRKTDVNDAMWLAELLAHGLIRASFVPDTQTQEMRNLLRTRKQLVREQSSHVLRVQKTLEDANIKLDSVLTDLMGGAHATRGARGDLRVRRHPQCKPRSTFRLELCQPLASTLPFMRAETSVDRPASPPIANYMVRPGRVPTALLAVLSHAIVARLRQRKLSHHGLSPIRPNEPYNQRNTIQMTA